MKIVYCTNSLSTRGGIERVTILKANALAEIDGNEVWIVFTDAFSFPQTIHPLSTKVKVVDLKVGHWDDQYPTRWKRFFVPKVKFMRHVARMQRFVDEVRPDVIISVGQSEKFVLPLLRHTRYLIREVHFNSMYRFNTALEVGRSLFMVKLLNFLDYRIVCRWLYHHTYLLTCQDKEENFPRQSYIRYMHNPSSFPIKPEKNSTSVRKKVVLSVGRLNHQKDFPTLIRSWSKIASKYPDWALHIVGEGPEKKKLEELIVKLKMTDRVLLPGFSSNVDDLLREASIYAMSSKYEGFALVLVEALSCRLPVVTVDFKYGARDIITNGVDGFIIANRDEDKFAQRLSQLIEDDILRHAMALAAEKSAERFNVEKIAEKWQKEFQSLDV